MLAWTNTKRLIPALVVAVAVLGLATAAGCSSEQGAELVSSTSDEYSSLVWVGDSVYYLVSDQDDSDTPPSLMRVRAGGRPERLTVDRPDCHGPYGGPVLSDIVAVSDHELGVVTYCGGSDGRQAEFVRWDVGGGQPATVATIDYYGAGITWSAGSGTLYYRASSCGSHPGMKAVGGRPSNCFGGTDTIFPAVAADSSVVYLANRCGIEAAEPDSTYAVCRYDVAGRVSTLGRGVQSPAELTVHGDRIAIAGEVHGKAGVWLVTAGGFDQVADGDYRGVAFTPDGLRLAVALEDQGWFSTSWSLRLIAVAHA